MSIIDIDIDIFFTSLTLLTVSLQILKSPIVTAPSKPSCSLEVEQEEIFELLLSFENFEGEWWPSCFSCNFENLKIMLAPLTP